MKRVLIRFSVLAVVVVLGWIAMAQAQRSIQRQAAEADEAVPEPLVLDAPPEPIATPGINEAAAAGPMDPFAAPSAASRTQAMAQGDDDAPPAVVGSRYADDEATAGPRYRITQPPAAVFPADTIPDARDLEDGGVSEPRTAEEADSLPVDRAAEYVADVPPAATAITPPRPAGEPVRLVRSDEEIPADPVPRRLQPVGSSPSHTPRYGVDAEDARYSDQPRRLDDVVESVPASRYSNSTSPPPAAPREVAEHDAPPADERTVAAEGVGLPGDRSLDGPQVPQVTLVKLAPQEIQVGKPATFAVTVRNTGKVTAHQVEIRDEVPRGTRLVTTTPRASQGAGGELVWVLDTLPPGEEATVQMEVMPTSEGEIGSVATVRFGTQASVRTVCTRPELQLQVTTARQVMIGQPVTLSIRVSNPGTGAATGVVLEEDVPAGLSHPAGQRLEYEIGTLAPRETRQLQLTLTAENAGRIVNVLRARGDANLSVEEATEIEVVAPALEIVLDGPRRRYLNREATYTVEVANPGTAPAAEVALVAYLPEGFEFVRADNGGQFRPEQRAVVWQFDQLPPNAAGRVNLTAIPVESGNHKLLVQSTAALGLAAEEVQTVEVEGITALRFEVIDLQDPIEVGTETTYEVRVINQGSKAATNVLVAAEFPPRMQPLTAEGATRSVVEGQVVQFEPLPRLAPKADTTYRIRAKGLQAGDMRIKVQVMADEMKSPVTKEESTRVYSDE